MFRASRFFFLLLVLVGGGYTSESFANKAPSLYDVDCKSTERATGCMAPFQQCEVGVMKSVAATCMMAAQGNRCPDFGWEKCCAANCFLRAGKKTSKMGACMEECGKASAASHLWPKAPKVK